MNKLRSVFSLVFIIMLSACVTTTADIEVSAAADPKAKLSGYKTYSWLAAGAWLVDPSDKWQPPGFTAGDTTKDLIDREMGKRAFTLTDKDPDLTVAFLIGINMEATKFRTDPELATKLLRNVPQGSLGIVLIDAETGYVIWMAQATADIQKHASDDLVRERLDYAVTKMFEQLRTD